MDPGSTSQSPPALEPGTPPSGDTKIGEENAAGAPSTLQQLVQLKEQSEAMVSQISSCIANIHLVDAAAVADLELAAQAFYRSAATAPAPPLSCEEVVTVTRQLLEMLAATERELQVHQRETQLVAGTTITRHQSQAVRGGLRMIQARVRELQLELEHLKQSSRALAASIARRVADERRAG